MKNNKLQFQQLNEKLEKYTVLNTLVVPPIGWIKAIRNGIGMSMEQLGKNFPCPNRLLWTWRKESSKEQFH